MMASSIKLRLQHLHTALQWGLEQGLLVKVPVFPKVKVPEKKPRPVPAESFERMLDKATDPQTAAFLLTGWLAGLRLSEALALEGEETDEAPYLDPARNRIVLPAELVKADEDQWVPLDPVLWQALRALPRQGKKVFRFISRLTGGPVTLSGMSDRVEAIAKKAGVRLTMHSLRKGFGCRYAGKVPAQVLQKLMRHSNIKVTMNYYANVDDAVMEAVLGPQRNSQHNTQPAGGSAPEVKVDATPASDTTSGFANEAR
jgi:integrase/recombinase XerD